MVSQSFQAYMPVTKLIMLVRNVSKQLFSTSKSSPIQRPLVIITILLLAIYILWPSAIIERRREISEFHTQIANIALSPLPPDEGNTPRNVATIIESRALNTLIPLLLQMMTILGPSWPIVLFTNFENLEHLVSSAPLQRLILSGRFRIRELPDEFKTFPTHHSVSKFLTLPWIWEQLAPAPYVLVFQADSTLCANAKLRVEDFLPYSYVGAPIDRYYGRGFNGGLSLRNRTMLLDILAANNWWDEFTSPEFRAREDIDLRNLDSEDQWFYWKMLEMAPETGVNLPGDDVAKMFAVETVWYDTPLGYHQVERWQGPRLEEVEAWCPEYKLATGGLLNGGLG